MLIEMTVRGYFTQTRLASIKKTVSNMLTSTWRNWNFHTLLIEMQNGIVSLETNLTVSCILRSLQPYAGTHVTTASSFLEIYPKGGKHTSAQRHWCKCL